MQKAQLLAKIERINIEIALTQNRIDTATVQKYGAISDFMILTIHKNTMKMHIKELNNEKNILNVEIENLLQDIIELQKEAEQFSYILEEEKKEAIQEVLSLENEEANEYIQSKYISKQKGFI